MPAGAKVSQAEAAQAGCSEARKAGGLPAGSLRLRSSRRPEMGAWALLLGAWALLLPLLPDTAEAQAQGAWLGRWGGQPDEAGRH